MGKGPKFPQCGEKRPKPAGLLHPRGDNACAPRCSIPLCSPSPLSPFFIISPCTAVHGTQGRAGRAAPSPPAAPQGAGVGRFGWESVWGASGSGGCIASYRTGGQRGCARLLPPRPKRRGERGEEGEEAEEEGASSCRPPRAGTHRSPMRLQPDERPRERAAAGPPRRRAGGGGGPEGGKEQKRPTCRLPQGSCAPLFNFPCEQEGMHSPL